MRTARAGAAARRARDAVSVLALPALVLQATAVPASAADDAPLGVAVTAAGSLVRSHGWTIDQSVDAVARSVDDTGRATFRWTATARAGGVTDSGWALAGDVSVTNPDADDSVVADVAVATDLGGGAACTVAGGDDAVVPAAGSLVLAWTCAFTSAPAASGSVSATASWGPDAHSTGTAPAELVVVEPDRTVAVVGDHAVPGQRVVLDPALAWAPGLVRSWTYDLALAGGAPAACATYANSVAVDLASGADPVVTTAVRSCTPEVLPAQAFGSPAGSVRARCRGKVRAQLANRSGETVVYKLRVGAKVHRIAVPSLGSKRFVTRGRALAPVTLKAGSVRLDRTRVPQRCAGPVTVPSLMQGGRS
ncbi:hypothetical protein CFI00_21980 [Nocardioides sp. S5]|nr:hypothetical protein CFI00_21980 [Nocardioides sp. S5]